MFTILLRYRFSFIDYCIQSNLMVFQVTLAETYKFTVMTLDGIFLDAVAIRQFLGVVSWLIFFSVVS